MKRIISIMLTALMLLSVFGFAVGAVGGVKVSGDYKYTLLTNGTAEIVEYIGKAVNLTVPSKIDGKTVSRIGQKAFSSNATVKNITISGGINAIGESAFAKSHIEKAVIKNGLKYIGKSAFSGCKQLKKVVIADSVKKIGVKAFYNCTSLKNIELSNNLSSIGSSAFRGTKFYNTASNWDNGVLYLDQCLIDTKENLKSVKIKKNTKIIANRAFEASDELTEITIPDSVKIVGDSAFLNCTNLKKVTINYGVKTIRAYAFCGCASLDSVTIPDSVKTIGERAFSYISTERAALDPVKNKNFKVFGGVGTVAQEYARRNRLSFIPLAPSVPSELTATQTATTIKLKWSKSTSAIGYRVYQYNTKTKEYKKLADTTKTTYTVNDLKVGTKYKFAVKAYSKTDGRILWSESKKLTTATKPATPTLKATAGSKKVTLTWDKVTGATGYVIYRATSKGGKYEKIFAVNDTKKYADTHLSTDKTFYYKVRAYKTAGGKNIYSAYSDIVKVTAK